jgi:hypothetical protein
MSLRGDGGVMPLAAGGAMLLGRYGDGAMPSRGCGGRGAMACAAVYVGAELHGAPAGGQVQHHVPRTRRHTNDMLHGWRGRRWQQSP